MLDRRGCNIKKQLGGSTLVISGNYLMMFVYSVVVFFVVNALVN